ncbi:MAG: hypothetical protein RSB67_01545 [Clostridia bacterium]
MDECLSTGLELLMLSNLVSIVLVRDLNESQQLILSSFLQMVGQNISSIASVCDLYQNENQENNIKENSTIKNNNTVIFK